MDLPAPLGPMRPIRSPSSTVRETLKKSGLAPNCLVTDWALRIGGISLKSTVSRQPRPSAEEQGRMGRGRREEIIALFK